MIISDWVPLFADVGDLLQFLVPAIFVIIWVISQVAGAGGQKGRRPARRAGQPKQQGGGGGGLSDQIESFLRQVQDQAGQGQPAQPARPDPVQPKPAREPALARSMPSEVVEAELVEPAPRPVDQPLAREADKPRRKRRSQRQRASRQRSRALRETEVDRADEKMASHMEQVFDHHVGSLADTSDAIHEQTAPESAVTVPEFPATVQAIRDMLAGPESARKAIILSEILSRPGR
jgi:hypothetical protein